MGPNRGGTPRRKPQECSTMAEVREGIEGNLCRCTGYQNIVRAVQQAAAEMRVAQA